MTADDLAELDRLRAKEHERQANARSSAAKKSKRVRAGIRKAINSLPHNSLQLGHWHLAAQVQWWIKKCGHASFGLEEPDETDLRPKPDRRVIKQVLDEMAREKDGHGAAS